MKSFKEYIIEEPTPMLPPEVTEKPTDNIDKLNYSGNMTRKQTKTNSLNAKISSTVGKTPERESNTQTTTITKTTTTKPTTTDISQGSLNPNRKAI